MISYPETGCEHAPLTARAPEGQNMTEHNSSTPRTLFEAKCGEIGLFTYGTCLYKYGTVRQSCSALWVGLAN